MPRSIRIAIVILVCTVLAAGFAVAKGKSRTAAKPHTYPNDGFPKITEAEMALTEVPYAPGAPAVLLLNAEQNHWEEINRIRLNYFRRLKILTEDGVEDYADFEYNLQGGWRIKKAEARTVLPDGTVIDASDGVFIERSKSTGIQEIRVAFPRAEVGAILDLHVTLTVDSYSVDPWYFQSDLPTLRSDLVLIPPMGLRFRTAFFSISKDDVNQTEINAAGGRRATVFTVTDMAPLPRVANRPPLSEVAARLLIIVDSYKDSNQYMSLASDWKSYIELRAGWADDWMKGKHAAAYELARQVAPVEGTALEKADAIVRALRERVRWEYLSDGYIHDSADEVLEAGFDNSGGIARTAATMLRGVEVDADLVQIRRRSSGSVPSQIPIPSMYNDMLLRIQDGSKDVYISPVADLPAGKLPWDCRGVMAVVLNEELETPRTIPDFPASKNRVFRVTRATLEPDGRLVAETTATFYGVAAERWRRWLVDAEEDTRHDRIENFLQAKVGGLQMSSFEIREMDNPDKPLKIKCAWEADGYVSSAGNRLILNPNLFDRVEADDWPDEERTVGIDLDMAYQTQDKLVLTLPEGAGEVKVPEAVTLNAGQAGLYVTKFGQMGNRLVAERNMKLELFRYGPTAYPDLRGWFSEIAAADDSMVLVSMP